jgi:hypothetical protein
MSNKIATTPPTTPPINAASSSTFSGKTLVVGPVDTTSRSLVVLLSVVESTGITVDVDGIVGNGQVRGAHTFAHDSDAVEQS